MIAVEKKDILVQTQRDPNYPERDNWVRVCYEGLEIEGTSEPTQMENRIAATRHLFCELVRKDDGISDPRYVVFECVETVPPNTRRLGTIEKMIWHYKDTCWYYYIDCPESKTTKRYVDSDLKNAQQVDGGS